MLVIGAVLAALTATMGVRLAARLKMDRHLARLAAQGSRRQHNDAQLRSATKRQRKHHYDKVNLASPAVVSAVDDMEIDDSDEEEFERAPVDEARDDDVSDDSR